MQINGRPVLTDHIPSIIEQLQKLPKGVKHTAIPPIRTETYLRNIDPMLDRLAIHGSDSATGQEIAGLCIKQLNNEFSVCSPDRDPVRAAHLFLTLGRLNEAIGDGEASLHYFRESFRKAKVGDERYVLATSGALLYHTTLDSLHDGTIHPETAEPILKECRDSIDWLMQNGPNNEKEFPNAVCLTEGEYGISDQEEMATDSVGECGVLVLRNPESHWTSMAHIDRYIDEHRFDVVLDGMPDGPEMPLLNASLAGMCDNGSVADGGAQRDILTRIIKFMLPRNINVTSAYILDKTGIGSYVVRPTTGELIEGVGQIGYERALFAKLAYLANKQNTVLEKAFDLTKTKQIKPCLIREAEMGSIVRLVTETPERRIFEDCASGFNGNEGWVVAVQHVATCMRFMKANEKASLAILKSLYNNVLSARTGDDNTVNIALNAAQKVILTAPKHIGEGADEANKPLVEMMSAYMPTRNPTPESIWEFQKRIKNFDFK